eukprot:4466444-Prorocentrum_lima.AAC.1
MPKKNYTRQLVKKHGASWRAMSSQQRLVYENKAELARHEAKESQLERQEELQGQLDSLKAPSVSPGT